MQIGADCNPLKGATKLKYLLLTRLDPSQSFTINFSFQPRRFYVESYHMLSLKQNYCYRRLLEKIGTNSLGTLSCRPRSDNQDFVALNYNTTSYMHKQINSTVNAYETRLQIIFTNEARPAITFKFTLWPYSLFRYVVQAGISLSQGPIYQFGSEYGLR